MSTEPTAIDALLAPIRARLAAAEPGPWFLDADGVSIYYVFHNGDTPDRDRLAESSGDDAKLIAAAPTDLARLLAAVEAAEEWCATNQHPTTDYPAGFSRQDYALDDAASRIRAAVVAALGGTA